MGFLSLDGTFVVQLINFAIFFALLNAIFLRPVGRAVRARREYIDRVTSDCDAYTGEAASLKAQADSIRAAARREAEQQIATARAAASNETAQIASEYSARVSEIVERAHQTAEGELQAARGSQDQQARDLAALIVDRTFSESAT